MGRVVLLTAALLAFVGACSPPEPGSLESGIPGDPHGGFTCAACHEFTLATQTQLAVEQLVTPDSITVRAPAPEARCGNSGCHEDGGPREVALHSISFRHRDHAGDSIVSLSCAGCHGHDTGSAPLSASMDPCSLCHLGEQSAGNQGECRVCHTNLEHAGITSQGLAIPHEGLPWVEGGCVRCHYDVTATPTEVSVLSCRACHDPDEAAVARGIGEDLHGTHTGVGCTACHEGGTHRIQAMTTAVSLECDQCHMTVHALAPTPDFPGTATCNDCHQAVHQAQQRMVLGLLPGVESPNPSEKFLDGVTCRSCHVPSLSGDLTEPVEGIDDGCTGCHRREFARVLDWWKQGSRDRIRIVDATLSRARETLTGNAPASTLLDSAALLLELVEAGHPVHNLPLSHQLLIQASDQVHQAYLDAGRSPPAPPDLGREPRMGLCSYCHYRLNDPWLFEEMSGPFHREVLRGR